MSWQQANWFSYSKLMNFLQRKFSSHFNFPSLSLPSPSPSSFRNISLYLLNLIVENAKHCIRFKMENWKILPLQTFHHQIIIDGKYEYIVTVDMMRMKYSYRKCKNKNWKFYYFINKFLNRENFSLAHSQPYDSNEFHFFEKINRQKSFNIES